MVVSPEEWIEEPKEESSVAEVGYEFGEEVQVVQYHHDPILHCPLTHHRQLYKPALSGPDYRESDGEERAEGSRSLTPRHLRRRTHFLEK